MNLTDLERNLTACLIYNLDLLWTIDGYDPMVFSDPTCLHAHMAMQELITTGTRVDMASVIMVFHNNGWNTSDLISLSEVPTCWINSELQSVYNGIRDAHYRRRAQMELHNLSVMAKTADSVQDIISRTTDLLSDLERGVTATCESGYMPALADDAIRYVEDRKRDRLEGKFYRWGIADLDEKTGGFYDEFVVIGANPSVGKTAFLNHIILSNGWQNTCLMFSLEMSKELITTRLISALEQINLLRMIRGYCSKEEMERIRACRDHLSKLHLIVHDMPCGIDQVRAVINREVKRSDVKIILLDYFAMLKIGDGAREEEFTKLSGQLKDIVKTTKLPMIIASHLTDQPEQTKGKQTQSVGKTKYTRALEQDADIFMIMKPGVDFIIKKARNGFTGQSMGVFRKEFVKFEDTPF